MKKYNIAVVGATGLVGRKILEILQEREFPIQKLHLLASKKSENEKVLYNNQEYRVKVLSEDSFNEDIDIAFFAAGGAVSEKYVPIAAEKGMVVVDNSSVFRMNPEVPLIVPEVNPEAIKNHKNIIANPNCSTIQCMPVLKPILEKYGIKRIVFSTYQSVSGSGTKGLRDLDEGLVEFYPHSIRGNVLPHIDVFLENGYTKEEMKMVNETRKILGNEDLKITATAVRVPVRFAHSVSVNLELLSEFKVEDIKELLRNSKGVVLKDDIKNGQYPITEDAEGEDEVFVGRIRRDYSLDSGLNLWIVADNIRKGAALNAVQIAEILIDKEESK
ncbi:MAG: aspartate-semialdehyde dehydrogenase [Gudongella sp.]|nr:aspartate-semialdehyde dehydrogenase [Gudongella sp.]